MEHAASLERSTPKQQQQQQQTSLLLSQLHQVAATAVAPNGDSSFYASLGRLAGAVAVRVKQQDPANNTNNQTNNSALPLLLEGSTATSVLAKAYLLAVVRVFSTTAPTTPTPSESDASHHPHRIISHRPTADPLFPEILETIGLCVSKVRPRSVIVDTGILSVLYNWMSYHESSISSSSGPDNATVDDALTVAHCEFLQACIFANQYPLAESHLFGTWPRPIVRKKLEQTQQHMHSSVASASVGSATTTTTARTTVETVLRYYYLRGVVHLNCGPKTSFHRAIRCFNTCLTVPTYSNDANVVSAIAVQAWKKLILVQCLQYCEEIGSDSSGCLNADATAATTTAKKPPPQLPASSFSSTNPSYYGSSPASDPMSTTFAATTTTVTTFGGSRNPLATPNDMSAAMSRFLSQSKPPVLSPHSTRLATVETQEPDSHSMHWVEVESNVENPTISNNNNPAPMDMDDDEIDERNSLERRYPSLGAYVYKQLVHAFMEIDRTAFAQLAQEHAALLVEDGNAGLVRRVNTALLHRHVYELSQVYSSVSLSQLAADLGISFSDLSALLVHLQTEKRWPVQWRQDEGSLDGTVELPSSLPVWPSPEDSHAVNQELSALTHMIQIFHVSMVKPTVGRSTSILANPMGGGTPRGVEDF